MCPWNRRVIVCDLILALVINTSATFLAGVPLAWGTWFPYTCVAFTTNVLAQLALPTGTIARVATVPLGEHRGRMFAQIFVENLIFVTIISLTEAFTQVGAEGMIAAWAQTYLWLMLIGYATSVVLALVPVGKGK
ncbi:MAG: ABC transporter ATPase [Acidobacteriota bacterium]|nr:ABC transporter ATPase [Acidobacteriota bacterium]